MLAGIIEHRAAVARVVRQERRDYDQPIPSDIDVDVSLFDGLEASAEGMSGDEHRRLACEARAELWQRIRSGEVDNSEEEGESVQVYEEWSHTE